MNKRKMLRQKKAKVFTGSKGFGNREAEIAGLLASASEALRSRQPALVESLCRQILILEANNSEAYRLLALSAEDCNQPDKALKFIRNALAKKPENIPYLCDAGRLYLKMGDSPKALECFEKAHQVNPGDQIVLFNLIDLYERTNRLKEMRTFLEQALKLGLDSNSLRYLQAKLEYRTGNPALSRDIILSMLSEGPGQDQQQSLYHLLGQACDRLGRYEEAYNAFELTNTMKAVSDTVRQQEANRLDCLQFIERLSENAASGLIPQPATGQHEDGLPAPIFLVGFPRSGTTLTGQILAAHPSLVTLDEKNTLSDLVDDFFSPQRYGRLSDLSPATISEYRNKYRSHLEQLAGEALSAGKKVVDKTPLNFCYMELLQLFFSDAKIIFIHRDPRDVCISSFMQDFSPNVYMNNFLFLENTVHFYTKAMELFLNNRQHLTLPLIELRYEDLLQDMKTEMTRVVSFLGEKWDDEMHAYNRKGSDKVILTPSYQQVAQPLYSSSVGRWKHYEQFLAPYLDRLEFFVDALGYG